MNAGAHSFHSLSHTQWIRTGKVTEPCSPLSPLYDAYDTLKHKAGDAGSTVKEAMGIFKHKVGDAGSKFKETVDTLTAAAP